MKRRLRNSYLGLVPPRVICEVEDEGDTLVLLCCNLRVRWGWRRHEWTRVRADEQEEPRAESRRPRAEPSREQTAES